MPPFAVLPNGSITHLASAIQMLLHKQTNTVKALQQAWTGGILPGASEVNTGWSMNLQTNESYSIGHNTGFPDFDWTFWQSSQANANKNMMYLSHKIPLSQLDGNGDG